MRCLSLATFGFAIALAAPAARAEFRLCNQSFDVLNIALGQPHDDDFRSEGWWRVAPNQCATLIRGDLPARYLYVFATDVFGKEALSGSVPLCVAPKRFRIEGNANCLLRGYLDARFVEIDTGTAKDWTLNIATRP
ncbi:DUF1036 domain-containing protein (plasmid) [Paracoccus sp. TK19116]|uniref:DUF1036 domain-containing protein n=1 Tax=Paracoccus albicereus TaxID=2922394 RepID=A0ABT1MLJ9_9RHOB|nr:DUF1036 domain-containing protein [Paracoccus albicereus]MCQ0969165.1 DUF1036 domain-containing protein [Paracoccus albicereus]